MAETEEVVGSFVQFSIESESTEEEMGGKGINCFSDLKLLNQAAITVAFLSSELTFLLE